MKSLLLIILVFTGCQSQPPKNLGLLEQEGVMKLSPCPESPNCISSSNEQDKDHYLPPLSYETDKENAYNLILAIINKTPRTKVIKKGPNYIHVEFTSNLFGFVDDVEFNFNEEDKIHFRSASRIGHSDLGANKKRMNEISFRFYQRDM